MPSALLTKSKMNFQNPYTMAAAASLRIELFYDVASPYTWLAFETLLRQRNKAWKGATIATRPFYLGGVMKATGNRPPGMLPAKAKYMSQDLMRQANYFNVPITRPKDPKVIMGTLPAMRLLKATEIDRPERLEALTREIWSRIWSRDEDITTPESLQEACAAVGMDTSTSAALLARAQDAQVKEALTEVTAEAINRGAFGAPAIFVQGVEPDPSKWHHFFGSDRFPQIAQLIGHEWEEPPLTAKVYAASRRGLL